VRLDEAAMGLRVEICEDIVERTKRLVEPRREHVDGGREVDGLEDEEGDDRLRPRRSALRRRGDDDVAVTEREAVPPLAVRDDRPVPHPSR
jgi:hypothetical protein